MASSSVVTSGGLFGGPPRPLFFSNVDDEDTDVESKPEGDPADIKLGLGQSDEGKIVSVSVYFNRAEVARSYTFRMTAGQHQVSISGLPTALDEGSIRVEGHGNATIQDVTVSKKDPTPPRTEKPVFTGKNAPKTSHKLEELEAQSCDLFSELERCKKTLMALDWYLEGRTRQIGSGITTANNSNPNTNTVADVGLIALVPFVDEYNQAAEKYDLKANAIRRQLKKLEAEIDEERMALEKAGKEPMKPRKPKVDRKRLAKVTVAIYAEEETDVELILKYFVSGAGWDAAYDVRASTTTKENPVEIVYKAAIQQFTGEDWTDVPITLETATPNSGFFVQSLPTLFPWNLSLYKPAPPPPPPPSFPTPRPAVFGASSFGASAQSPNATTTPTAPAGGLFGAFGAFGTSQSTGGLFGAAQSSGDGGGSFGSTPPNVTGGLFGSATPSNVGGGLFGTAPSSQPTATVFGSAAQASGTGLYGSNSSGNTGTGLFGISQGLSSTGGGLFGGPGVAASQHSPERLAVPKAEVASQGSVNATFKVPGTISIPSDGASHNVTIVSLKPAAKLTWMAVPSVDARAHLTAKITNDSEFTLLKGVAVVFVDGTFITKSTVPLVSPDETFSLALGLDPSIRLTHPPILKQHRTSGLLTKTSLTSFTQRITIHNSKSVGIENLRVLSRIPVSLDSQINVKLIEPALVLPPQPSNGTTTSAKSAGNRPPGVRIRVKEGIVAQWCPNAFEGGGGGSASIDESEKGGDEGDEDGVGPVEHLGKDGKIQWTCKVEARTKVELALRFEVGVPISETVVGL